MSQYIISDEALQDLKDISEYFLQNNLEAGETFLQIFSLKCRQLINFPKMGRRYDHLRQGIRGLPIRGFILLYRVRETQTGSSIEILRIVNGRRDLATIFTSD